MNTKLNNEESLNMFKLFTNCFLKLKVKLARCKM